MTQEDKNLLLQDLCGRLLYDVKVQYLTGGNDKTYVCNVDQVSIKSQCVGIAEIAHTVFTWRIIDRIKPYLRPMSSMTEEEVKEFNNLPSTKNYQIVDGDLPWDVANYKQLDWLNKKMFDYRGLIPKGFALEAPEGMYN